MQKIKIRELINRKERIERLIDKIEELSPQNGLNPRGSAALNVSVNDAEDIEATLEKYGKLLDALLDSAEVSI